jgi:hypothetical protein
MSEKHTRTTVKLESCVKGNINSVRKKKAILTVNCTAGHAVIKWARLKTISHLIRGEHVALKKMIRCRTKLKYLLIIINH